MNTDAELDISTDYGKLVCREFFSGKYDTLTVKEFRELMHSINMGGVAMVQIGIKDIPKADLHIIGTVCRVEEVTYDYGDIRDERYNSMLTMPLLQFEGKRVEITVNIIDESSAEVKSLSWDGEGWR